MPRPSTRSRRAFAIPELFAVALVVLLLLVLAIPAAHRLRLAGWDAVDGENLHRFAGATTEYAADNGDKYWTFSWQSGEQYVPDMPPQDTDVNAAVCQAVEILHRKAGREDISTSGLIGAWFPHIYYSQLPLYDYLDQEMPALWGVCPADRIRLTWAMDPAAFDQGEFLPCQPAPVNANKRWPYSSSYDLSTSFFDHSQVGSRVEQAGAFNTYAIPGDSDLHARMLGETDFPSQKVHLHESVQHHIDEDTPDRCESPQRWAVPDSRIAILFTDGHSGLMQTSEANRGWQPNHPDDPDPTCVSVAPDECYPGVYHWTREFLAGRDDGGPEVGLP